MVYANFPLKLPNGTTLLPDGSAFCVVEIDTEADPGPPIKWNPYNKVVQDHRDGTIDHVATNIERAKRGLPVPWTPEMTIGDTIGRPIP
jgi:hypothetical protein